MKKPYYLFNSFFKASIFASSLFFSFNSFAQNGVVWTKVQDIGILEIKKENNKLSSSNTDVQQLIDSYSIYQFELAVPNSRKSKLQNVVEVKCDCEETDLLIAMSQLKSVFLNPEIGPHYETLMLPNDYSIAFSDDYALNLINAQEAWDITTGDSSIVIAISDQNFYVDHEELIGKIHYYDTTNIDLQYHGTAVAATAAGNTNNSLGKSSIGYNSELALYRMNYNDVLLATYSGYRVINLSWYSGCEPNAYVQDVIDEVYENGSIVVAAAGNGGTCGGADSLVYPAACNHVIAVTSIGSSDNHELYIGDTNSTHQHNSDVDISAPGYLVPLTIAPDNYLVGNGTSFAAPFVSGTIALMLSVDSCLSFEEVETILYTTSVNIDSLNPQYAGLIGHGRLDAAAAITMANTFNSCDTGNGTTPSVHDNYQDAFTTEYTGTVSLVENEDNKRIEITVFPNPTNFGNAITIISNQIIEKCEITNVSGEMIQVLNPIDDKVTVTDLTPGIYFARVHLKSGFTKMKKIIVQY